MSVIQSVFINLDMHGKRTITITRAEIPDFSGATTVTRLVEAIRDKEGGSVAGAHLYTLTKPLAEERNGRQMTMGDYNIQTNAQLFGQLRLLGGATMPATTSSDLELPIEGRTLDVSRFSSITGISTTSSVCAIYMSDGCETTAPRFKIDCGGVTGCANCMAKTIKQQIMAAKSVPALPDRGTRSCSSNPGCIHSQIIADDTGNLALRCVAAMAHLSPAEEHQIASRYFANNQTVKICPNSSCGAFVFTDERYRVRCPQCRSGEWCYVCRNPWRNGSSNTFCGNDGCKDQLLTLWNQILSNTETASVSGSNNVPTTRKCPNPRCSSMPIVRDRNCKHITCEVCGEGFCLSCLSRASVSGSCSLSNGCTPAPIQNITSLAGFE